MPGGILGHRRRGRHGAGPVTSTVDVAAPPPAERLRPYLPLHEAPGHWPVGHIGAQTGSIQGSTTDRRGSEWPGRWPCATPRRRSGGRPFGTLTTTVRERVPGGGAPLALGEGGLATPGSVQVQPETPYERCLHRSGHAERGAHLVQHLLFPGAHLL